MNRNRLSANLCQPNHSSANNGDDDDENNSSAIDSFSLHLPVPPKTNNNNNNKSSSPNNANNNDDDDDDDNDSNDSDDTSTSDVTWLTYRDEKCNQVKEEFIRRLKLTTASNGRRVLSVVERRALLESIVREHGRREEVAKEWRKREERQSRQQQQQQLQQHGEEDYLTVDGEEESSMMTDDDEEGNNANAAAARAAGGNHNPHPAALFDSNNNFIGNIRGTTPTPAAADEEGGDTTTGPISSSSSSFPQYYSSSGGGGRIMGGLDLVKEETRSDLHAAGGTISSKSRSVSESNLSSKTPPTDNKSTTSTDQQQQQQQINQEHINSIVNLKLLVANQQTQLDALSSKLHHVELANIILQSENKILAKNNEMQQQQLIQKTREVMEMKRYAASNDASVVSSSSVVGAGAPPVVVTNHSNSAMTISQEQFTIRALETKLQQMDQMNKLLVQENMQMQMQMIMMRNKQQEQEQQSSTERNSIRSGGSGGSKKSGESGVATAVDVALVGLEEEKEMVEEVEEVVVQGGEGVVEQPPMAKEVTTTAAATTTNQPSLDFLRNKKIKEAIASDHSSRSSLVKGSSKKEVIPSKQVSPEVSKLSSSKEITSKEVIKNTIRKTTRFADQQERSSTTTSGGFPLRRQVSAKTSSEGSVAVIEPIRYKSQIASSNKLFGDAKLLSGLVNRLGISGRLHSNRGENTIRVEDLSKELAPIVGAPKFCAMIHNVLSPEECTALIRRSKTEQFEELSHYRRRGSTGGAPSNISVCKRCRLNDANLAVVLLQRILDALKGTTLERAFQRRPSLEGDSEDEEDQGQAGAILTRISEPFNVIRYDVGEFFAPHRDTTFRTGKEVSHLTLQVFLNEKFSGGTTSIRQGKEYYNIKARVGSVLLIDQSLRREECYVVSGKKYVLRADIMYDESKADDGGATAVTESVGAYTRGSGYTRETNPSHGILLHR